MITLILLVSALLSASAKQAPAPAAAPAGNAEGGKRLYMKHTCYFCHGTVGQGAPNTGARLAAVARNLQGFTRYVRQPSGQMPAYTDKILSDQELADIFAYLRALTPAKPAREIPLLEQLRDKR